jgi:hypothetical protein
VVSVVENERARRRWQIALGGPDGNERLTSALGLSLFVLLPVEAATVVSLQDFLSVHLFLGLLLIPPIAVKLATTGWRFAGYYLRREPYRVKGPPDLFLRLLAPPLVLSTVVLFGTGVAFLVVGHGGGLLLTAHAASFVAFGGLVTVHSLAYLTRAWRHGGADWGRAARGKAGSGWRRAVLAVALLAGIAVAVGTYSAQTSWLAHRHHHHERFDEQG